jgi:hypothetical protein
MRDVTFLRRVGRGTVRDRIARVMFIVGEWKEIRRECLVWKEGKKNCVFGTVGVKSEEGLS